MEHIKMVPVMTLLFHSYIVLNIVINVFPYNVVFIYLFLYIAILVYLYGCLNSSSNSIIAYDNDNNDNDNILFDHKIRIETITYNSLENQIINWSGIYY